MINKTKYRGLSLVLAMVGMFSSQSASAFTYSTGGTPVAGEGLVSSVLGAVTQDFNSTAIDAVPAGYTGGLVKNGTNDGLWASPPLDTSNFYSVGPATSTPGTLTFGSLVDYFGFYGGSPDDFNSIQLYKGSTLVKSLTGIELATLAGVPHDGDRGVGYFFNIFAQGSTDYFNTVKFISTKNAFETDNHAIREVPEPETYAMMLAGLGLVGFMARRRKISA